MKLPSQHRLATIMWHVNLGMMLVIAYAFAALMIWNYGNP